MVCCHLRVFLKGIARLAAKVVRIIFSHSPGLFLLEKGSIKAIELNKTGNTEIPEYRD